MVEEQKTIDLAISSVEEQIGQHQKSAKRILLYVIYFAVVLIFTGAFLYSFQIYQTQVITDDYSRLIHNVRTRIESSDELATEFGKIISVINNQLEKNQIDPSSIYAFIGVFIVVFGVMMAIYRFHLTEISRAHQYRFGLLRIRIAANNYDIPGFDTEVRQSLTHDAFQFSTGKEKKIESPLPGHPSSDLVTIFLNKFFDSFKIEAKVKDHEKD